MKVPDFRAIPGVAHRVVHSLVPSRGALVLYALQAPRSASVRRRSRSRRPGGWVLIRRLFPRISSPVKDLIKELVLQAVLDLRRQGKLPAGDEPSFVIERTRNKAHGDYACNVALLMAKAIGKNPRELAQALLDSLPQSRLISKAEIAGPGFINFFVSPTCLLGSVRRVLERGESYGFAEPGSRGTVTVEFVSANPNGPLHVGHGRGAAYGASLSNVLEADGWTV